MESWHRKASLLTPEISWIPGESQLSISGVSRPESARVFYAPLWERLKAYLEQEKTRLTIHFAYDYIDAGTYSQIIKIMELLQSRKKSHSFKIKWSYDPSDLSVREVGEDLKDIYKLKISLKETA